ncbi:MAG: hypothetical protein ACE5H2_00900 [Terriglobia bacterium]
MKHFSFGSLACALAGCLALAILPAHAQTYSFRVKHSHAFGACQGTLLMSEQYIRYETDHRTHARIWRYPQVKKIRRKGLRQLIIHTYEDQLLQLGRDKKFQFQLLDGVVSNEVFNFVIVRIGRPADSQPPTLPRGGRYEIAAKHLHVFGGCEGTLKITPTHIEYVSGKAKDSRLWKYLDIKRVRHSSTYRLSIATYEDQVWLFGRDKTFNFQLKEALEPEVLEFMRSRMNR